METIIIADDHPVILNGLAQYVTSLGYKVLGQYTNGISAYNNILSQNPDYSILDISMPGMSGLEVLEKTRARNKSLKIILYTMYHERALFEKAKSLDINGYLFKDFALEELKGCLEYLKFKKQWFTPRLESSFNLKKDSSGHSQFENLTAAERKIISLIAQRKSSREIAGHLFLSEKTVENHRSNIIKKLDLDGSKNVLLMWAIANEKLL